MVETRTKRFLVWSIVLIFVAVAAYFVLPVSVPLILAFLTASLFEPLVRWCTNRFSMSRRWSVFSVFVIIFSIVSYILYIFISRGIAQIVLLAEKIPAYSTVLTEKWEDWNNWMLETSAYLPEPVLNELGNTLENIVEMIAHPLKDYDYLSLAATFGAWLPMFLVSILVYFIAVFLFMLEMPRIVQGFYRHLKEETEKKVRFIFSRLSNVFWGYIKAQFFMSVIVFAVAFIGLLIVAPRYALVISLLIWFIDFIPLVGSIIVMAPWTIIEFASGNTWTAVGLLILGIVLIVVRRSIEPKILGEYIGLSPLATLISMFLGVHLLGFFGLILGPMLVILYNAAKEVGLINVNFKI